RRGRSGRPADPDHRQRQVRQDRRREGRGLPLLVSPPGRRLGGWRRLRRGATPRTTPRASPARRTRDRPGVTSGGTHDDTARCPNVRHLPHITPLCRSRTLTVRFLYSTLRRARPRPRETAPRSPDVHYARFAAHGATLPRPHLGARGASPPLTMRGRRAAEVSGSGHPRPRKELAVATEVTDCLTPRP